MIMFHTFGVYFSNAQKTLVLRNDLVNGQHSFLHTHKLLWFSNFLNTSLALMYINII